jgi:hypothetical protein
MPHPERQDPFEKAVGSGVDISPSSPDSSHTPPSGDQGGSLWQVIVAYMKTVLKDARQDREIAQQDAEHALAERQRRADRDTQRVIEEQKREADERMRAAMTAIGLGLLGVLIGLLLYMPAASLRPVLGLEDVPGVALPPCPAGSGLPVNKQLVLVLNDFRATVGTPLCAPSAPVTTGPGGDTSAGGQTTGGSVTAGGCVCQGTDYICTNPDGTVASASFNSGQCGGSAQCECRGTTLACPDGTYAEFNPQCGVGAGGNQCTCVPNAQCQQFPKGQCPYPENVCKEDGTGC